MILIMRIDMCRLHWGPHTCMRTGTMSYLRRRSPSRLCQYSSSIATGDFLYTRLTLCLVGEGCEHDNQRSVHLAT